MSPDDSFQGRLDLAYEIAHCPQMVKCLKGAKHPCSKVVLAQWPEIIDRTTASKI